LGEKARGKQTKNERGNIKRGGRGLSLLQRAWPRVGFGGRARSEKKNKKEYQVWAGGGEIRHIKRNLLPHLKEDSLGVRVKRE